ncbi:MAG: hypothetical protein PHE79_10975, partial [Eubacteriales bacterium]|nr:hypothetical protein [Eubacteriales bacterium]
MRKIRLMACLLAATLVVASFAGCESSEVTGADSATDQEKSGARQERGVMAKVVSLNNDQLTVILADMPSDMPKGGDEGGTPPDKGTPPAMNTSPGSYSLPPGNTAPGGAE